jgi:hypothetical protein
MLQPIELLLITWRLAMRMTAEVILFKVFSHIVRAIGHTLISERVFNLRVDRDWRCQVDGGRTADGNVYVVQS